LHQTGRLEGTGNLMVSFWIIHALSAISIISQLRRRQQSNINMMMMTKTMLLLLVLMMMMNVNQLPPISGTYFHEFSY